MSYDNMDVSSQENILIKMIVNTRNNNSFFNPGHPVPGGKDCGIIRFNPLENERNPCEDQGNDPRIHPKTTRNAFGLQIKCVYYTRLRP